MLQKHPVFQWKFYSIHFTAASQNFKLKAVKLTGNCWSWMKLFFQKCFYSTTWPVLGGTIWICRKKTFFSILIAKFFHLTCKRLSCCPTIRITPMMLARKPLDYPIPFVCTLEGSQKWQTRLWTSALFRTSASNVNNFFRTRPRPIASCYKTVSTPTSQYVSPDPLSRSITKVRSMSPCINMWCDTFIQIGIENTEYGLLK